MNKDTVPFCVSYVNYVNERCLVPLAKIMTGDLPLYAILSQIQEFFGRFQ